MRPAELETGLAAVGTAFPVTGSFTPCVAARLPLCYRKHDKVSSISGILKRLPFICFSHLFLSIHSRLACSYFISLVYCRMRLQCLRSPSTGAIRSLVFPYIRFSSPLQSHFSASGRLPGLFVTQLSKENPAAARGSLYLCLKRKKRPSCSRRMVIESGDDLSSRAVASQVLSTCEVLTSVFGMGTGGTPQPLSPEILGYWTLCPRPENRIIRISPLLSA